MKLTDEQKAEFLKDPLTDDKMTQLIKGQTIITGTDWLDRMIDHPASNYIATIVNPKRIGTKDLYVAWIGDEAKPGSTIPVPKNHSATPISEDYGTKVNETESTKIKVSDLTNKTSLE